MAGARGCFSLALGKKPLDIENSLDAPSVLGGNHALLRNFRDPSTSYLSTEDKRELEVGERVVIFDIISSGSIHLKAVRLP